MTATRPFFRADQVGSLLRPAKMDDSSKNVSAQAGRFPGFDIEKFYMY